MNKEIKEEYKAIGETDDEIIYEVKWTEENGYYTDKIKIPKSFIQFQKQDLIKKKKYLICEECGATAKEVNWKEYRKIKKRFELLTLNKEKLFENQRVKNILENFKGNNN